MNVNDFFEVYTGGNDYIKTWTPSALKDFAEAYHRQKVNQSEGWISVNDRMPRDGERVMVYVEEQNNLPPYHLTAMISENEKYTLRFHELYYYQEIEGITHWRPLPSPPKTDNQ